MKETTTKTIQQRLNEIDYSFENYKPSLDALMFAEFIKEVNKSSGGEENETPLVHLKMLDLIFDKTSNRKAIMCSRGLGKALEINTPVLTTEGYKPMKDIKVGDILFDREGQQTKVTYKSETFSNQCYKIKLSSGDEFITNEDHLNILIYRNGSIFKEVVLSTKELFQRKIINKRKVTEKNPKGRELLYYIPKIENPIIFPKTNKFQIDPYTVGYILGDGTLTEGKNTRITCDIKDMDEICSYLPYNVTKNHYPRESSKNVCEIRFTESFHHIANQVIGTYKRENKCIPYELLYGTLEERIETLRGLMDSDGTANKKYNSVFFCNISRQLAYGVHHIVRSLGGYSKVTHYKNNYNGYYITSFSLKDICPFKLKRKADIWHKCKDKFINRRFNIESIEPIEAITYSQCISVDSPTKSYIIDNFIITHNTTLTAEYGFLYAACFNKYMGLDNINVAMYVGNSLEKGAKDLRRNIEQRYINSEFLQKMIPNKKYSATDTTSKYPMPLSENDMDDIHNVGRRINDVRIEFVNINKKPFCIRLFGVNSGIRGFKEYGKRVEIAVADDLLLDSDARSDTVIKNIEEVIYKAITYAMHPRRNCLLLQGTPFNSKDPLYKAIEGGGFKSVVFPIAEKFPCEKNEFKGAWEDRFDYNTVKKMYDTSKAGGQEQAFRQEMMLQIIPEEGLLVPQDKIITIPSETFEKKRKEFYNFYITTDFAYTDKESSDYSVISVWAINNNGDYILCDGYCGKALIDALINKIFEFNVKYNPLQVGFEITGQQIGFVNLIRNEMITRNNFFNLKEIRPTKDKFSRFNLATPLFHNQKIMICSNMMKTTWGTEFKDEIGKATVEGFKSKHDDVLDTFSMLLDLDIFAPSVIETNDGRDALDSEMYDMKNNLIF